MKPFNPFFYSSNGAMKFIDVEETPYGVFLNYLNTESKKIISLDAEQLEARILAWSSRIKK